MNRLKWSPSVQLRHADADRLQTAAYPNSFPVALTLGHCRSPKGRLRACWQSLPRSDLSY
jgi:hypothetical protein